MGRAKRARTAETPKQPSLCLMLRALHFYPDRDRKSVQGADAVSRAEGNTGRRASASTCLALRGRRPWHARTLLAREPGDLSSGQSLHWAGPHREGEEP
jgi:hypothetical protein